MKYLSIIAVLMLFASCVAPATVRKREAEAGKKALQNYKAGPQYPLDCNNDFPVVYGIPDSVYLKGPDVLVPVEIPCPEDSTKPGAPPVMAKGTVKCPGRDTLRINVPTESTALVEAERRRYAQFLAQHEIAFLNYRDSTQKVALVLKEASDRKIRRANTKAYGLGIAGLVLGAIAGYQFKRLTSVTGGIRKIFS